jgi:hypothetical protein
MHWIWKQVSYECVNKEKSTPNGFGNYLYIE